MESYSLLFILPDISNKRILALKSGDQFYFPFYDKPVDINVGFDEPQMFNDIFREAMGIHVFRRYTFNTQNYVVFVFEQAEKTDSTHQNGYDWVSYEDFIAATHNDEVRSIAQNVSKNYNISENMPWVNADGFLPYFKWLRDSCAEKQIYICGKITQIKNAYVSTVFCIETNIGNLYMKIPGKIYLSELPLTHELKRIMDLPIWLAYDFDMNVVLMEDMGGDDLPPQADINTLHKVISKIAKIQKDTLQLLPSDSTYYDYSVSNLLKKLKDFHIKSFDILKGTPYELTQGEFEQLAANIATAAALLESVAGVPVPNTINHGDIRPGNIRVTSGGYIIYDWSQGAVTHPFVDYDWVEAIHLAWDGAVDTMSADGWLLERRNYYFANVLRRFLGKTLV